MNFNEYLKKLFGNSHGLDNHLTYCLQFVELTAEQIEGSQPEGKIPERLKAYIAAFDGALTHEEYNNQRFSYRLLLKRKLVNHPGQADRVIEFIDSKSDLAKTIDKEYWVKKEVEKPKYRAKDVVKEVRKAGFNKFRIGPEHIQMWRDEDARNPAKGFGVEIQGAWYWYENWIKRYIELCKVAGDRYL